MATRASLSLTEPNEEWIKSKIDSKEFMSRSEVVNDLIRKAREIESIRERLIAAELAAEKEGWINKPAETMLSEFKDKARRDGKI